MAKNGGYLTKERKFDKLIKTKTEGNFKMVPKTISNHPGVLEAELSQDSDYKYEVFLKEGWSFERGRNQVVDNVKDFLFAKPINSVGNRGS